MSSYVVKVERDSRKREVAPAKSRRAILYTPSYTFSLFLRSQSAPPGCSSRSFSLAICLSSATQSSWKMQSRMTLKTISIFWPMATVFFSHASNAASALSRSPTSAKNSAFASNASLTSESPRLSSASLIFASSSATRASFLARMSSAAFSSIIHPNFSQYGG